MKTKRDIACIIMIGFVLLVQFMSPTLAYAGGGPPPHQTQTPAPTEPPPPETPVPTEAPGKNTTAAPVVTESAGEPETTTAQTTLPDILEKLHSKIRVVALNENGKPLPLAAQDAAAVIANGDPVWCPGTQAPTPGANGCTASYATLGDLVAAEGGNIAADGTIWITTGSVADTSAVTIDGSIYTNWATHSLALQGGWDGFAGSDAVSSNSIFSVPIAINTWVGNVTINNLTVQNAAGTGLSVITEGAITAHNIAANGNADNGAYLRGISSITMTGANEFNSNGSSNNLGLNGLVAVSQGNIILNNIMANGNGSFWARNASGASLFSNFGNITLTGTNVFNNNNLGGLHVFSGGSITLSQVSVSSNGDAGGARLYSNSDISINGLNAYNNHGIGLIADSDADITLNQVTVNNNISGALLQSSGSLTVMGISEFNNNSSTGLVAYSDGNITLYNVTATSNNVFGTKNVSDILLATPGNVTIDNSTIFSLDATAVCGSLSLIKTKPMITHDPVSGEHTFWINGQKITIYCDPKVYVDGQLLGELPTVLSTLYAFDLTCDNQILYPRELPNGDKVTIFCPISGRALISRLDNTTIPPNLPAGYTYASAFSVSILQNGEPVQVITEGGHIEVSFQVPSQQDSIYSILYWDDQNNTWIPLNDFIGPENSPQDFALNPDLKEDLREVTSGVELVTRNGVQRVEVSTNFPGIFVLAQH